MTGVDAGRWTRVLGTSRLAASDAAVRDAAWVARCVGRGESAPLSDVDLAALAGTLRPVHLEADQPMFAPGDDAARGVWIVRSGRVQLSVSGGRRPVVVGVLGPGDVDGDIPLLLDMGLPYAARAMTPATCLRLSPTDFEGLLSRHPAIARRWLSSVAQRLATSHERLVGLLGLTLAQQVAGLLLDEAEDGGTVVRLPQRTLAALLGVTRPSLNKVLRDLERRGHVRLGYAEVHLLDPEALHRARG